MQVIDVHCHLGVFEFPIEKQEKTHLIEIMKKCQIERGIFSSTKAIHYDIIMGNKDTAELVKDNDRCWGYVVVNPNQIDRSIKELEKYFPGRGFIGVKVHPAHAKLPFDGEEMKPILDKINQIGVPVKVHTFYKKGVKEVFNVAKKYPEMKIIMAHTGGPDWKDGIRAAKATPNIYLDLCSSYPDRGKFAAALEGVGEDRIVFGSDLPLLNPLFVMGMFELEGGIPARTKQKVFYQNAWNLFFNK